HGLARESITLAQIEQELRDIGEPRALLAICKANRGGAPLLRRIYNQTALEQQLEVAANNYCNNPAHFRVDRMKKQIRLSPVFLDYGTQFRESPKESPAILQASYSATEAAVLAFILPRISSDDRNYVLKKRPRIVYDTMDWRLNGIE
ncbi:MAG: DUF547 domain-containing protein, partial [Candidatus Sumerlaeaceae bacterium]|nr:DUF547 domain-containing protein [Candidatus Sumerlaeaceae bacterium]